MTVRWWCPIGNGISNKVVDELTVAQLLMMVCWYRPIGNGVPHNEVDKLTGSATATTDDGVSVASH